MAGNHHYSSSSDGLDIDPESERGGTLTASTTWDQSASAYSLHSASAPKRSTMDKVKDFLRGKGRSSKDKSQVGEVSFYGDEYGEMRGAVSESAIAPASGVLKKIRQSFRKKKSKPKRRNRHDPNTQSGASYDTSSRESLSAVGHGHSRPPRGLGPIRNEFTDAFISYRPKSKQRPYGMGAFLVFPFFTEDLTGYKVDVKSSIEFFHKELGYQLFQAPANGTKAHFLYYLNEFRREIQESPVEYDRLVCIVLTHGLKDGLLTCANSGGLDEERHPPVKDADGKTREKKVFTKVEEILEFFKHDEEVLPKLKGCPKLFIIQACQGTTVVKAANRSSGASMTDLDTTDGPQQPALNLPFNPTVPIDADIEVCYATTIDNYSFVHPNHGSWLIQDMLRIFRKHMRARHVAEMLTVLRLSVSEKRMRFEIEEGIFTTAIQIPSVTSTFRKQFWLHHGQMVTSHSEQVLRAAGRQEPSVIHRHNESYPGGISRLATDRGGMLQRVEEGRSPGAFRPRDQAAFSFENLHIHDYGARATDDNAVTERRRNISGSTTDSSTCSCPVEPTCRRSSHPLVLYSSPTRPIYIINQGEAQPQGRPVSRGQATQTSVKKPEEDRPYIAKSESSEHLDELRSSLEDTLSGESTPIVRTSDASPLARLEK